jgi:threonyl-tRNA synthetase
MKAFGFNEYHVELSTRPAKSIGTDKDWDFATGALKDALSEKGISYDINEGDGAFYGPKIDIKLKDALGRSWQCATIQCDFALAARFDLKYTGEDGQEHRPVMIHRVLLGSIERFIGALVEHYGGALPVWLSPVQARVIPISEALIEYANSIKAQLAAEDIRVDIDLRNETLNKKIRQAQTEKIPYMLIVGHKEKENNTISMRTRQGVDQGAQKIDEFLKKIKQEINNKQ